MSHKKIAIIGFSDTVIPFQAVGVDAFSVNTDMEVRQILQELLGGEYALIFLEETFGETLTEDIKNYNNLYPNISINLIPGARGSRGTTLSLLQEQIIKAIGMDILAE